MSIGKSEEIRWAGVSNVALWKGATVERTIDVSIADIEWFGVLPGDRNLLHSNSGAAEAPQFEEDKPIYTIETQARNQNGELCVAGKVVPYTVTVYV